MSRWTRHTPATDPGGFAAHVAALPAGPSALARAVQGLLIHGETLRSYGLPAPDTFSRHTLPVVERLAAILAEDDSPLSQARLPARRALGTCRDFALLVCAALRHRGVPARLRCGFASYLAQGRWEDHWLCEAWAPAEERWLRVDAQLDEVQRQVLGVAFDPADAPRDAFITADQAWRECRLGSRVPADFGHGEARGLWFIRVNVVRDHLALYDRITSAWDTWREAVGTHETLSAGDIAATDLIAAGPADPLTSAPNPPWSRRCEAGE